MAESTHFGKQLKIARRQMNMSLDEAGRRLRIEPSALDAIEHEDFTKMPPKYMTRRMVNSYAQLVGLNPTQITRAYLDAEFQYQMGLTNGTYDNSQANNQISTRIASSSTIKNAVNASTAQPQRPNFNQGELPRSTDNVTYRQSSNTSMDATVDSVWQPGGIPRVSPELESDTGRQRVSASENASSPAAKVRRASEGTIRRPHFTATDDEDVNYVNARNETQSSRAASVTLNTTPHRDYSRIIMIVGSILAIVIIIVLIRVLFVPDNSDGVDTTNSTISGLTDPESSGISTSNSDTIESIAVKPTEFYVRVVVSDDAPSDLYIGVYESDSTFINDDGEVIWDGTTMLAYVNAEAGSMSTYQTSSFFLVHVHPNYTQYVTVYVNGEEAEWVTYSAGAIGKRACILLDFETYLEEWEAEHESSDDSSTSDSSTSDSSTDE